MSASVEKAIGIDLGTTNSVVGVLDLSDRRLLLAKFGEGENQEPLLPSAVAWLPDEKRIIVGRPARARRGLDPEPILSVKRKMGLDLKVRLADNEVSPSTVSSLVLKELAARVRATIAGFDRPFEVLRAVITVPAHFKQPAMEATTRAGEEAGLQVVELLHEPIAAVIHYCWHRKRERHRAGEHGHDQHEETFLIFDMGGGTHDVSVVRKYPSRNGDDFQTLGIAGDPLLGGDNFDQAIARDLFQRVARTGYQFDTTNPGELRNRSRFAKLLALAEQVKIRLSDQESVTVDRGELFLDDHNRPVHVQTTYTRPEVDLLIGEDARAALRYCDEAMAEARLDIGQIDTILMIGGSSRVPLVQQLVRDKYCRGPSRVRCPQPLVHAPDLCVGAGAALKAASLGRIYRRGPNDPGVRMLNYGSAASSTTTVVAEICDDLKPEEPGLAGGQATLTHQADSGPTQRGDIRGQRRAVFKVVPLATEQNTFFQLSLRDGKGADRAAFDFSIRHDPQFVEPLGLNTSANVLSYKLELEGRDRRGKLVRTEMAKKLTVLPNEFEYVFEFPGGAKALVFPLYGDDRLIKRILVAVDPSTPAGSEIKLFVAIDAGQRVRCRGGIPQAKSRRSFAFEVEAPEPEPVPTPEDFYQLRAQVEAMLEQYRGPDAVPKAIQASKLLRDIERAFEHRDDAQVIQRMRDLRKLAQDIDPSKQHVDPPLEQFEGLVDQFHLLVREVPSTATIDIEELSRDVETNASAGRLAARRVPPDKETYTKCYRNIKAACETLDQAIPPPPPEQEALDLIRMANKEHAKATQRREDANREHAEASPRGEDADDDRLLRESRAEINEAEEALHANKPKRAADAARKAIVLARQVGQKLGPATDEVPPEDGHHVIVRDDP